MKNLLYIFLILIGVTCCSAPGEEYVVKGSTSQARLDGQRIFIVPYGSKSFEDSIGVDSTVIKNGKFEFRSRKGEYLARVTVDRRVRYGTQDLLIVTEPGEITVVIDSVSSAVGTPQNDALQTWKILKEDRDKVHWNQSQHIQYLRQQGDTVYANSLADSLRVFNQVYLDRVRAIIRTLPVGSPAYDLLNSRYGE